jgi:hypothetical protein
MAAYGCEIGRPPWRRIDGRYRSAVEDGVWVELEPDVQRVLWAEFVERFQFRAGVNPEAWPAIVEPVPSVVWDLGPIFEAEAVGGFAAGSREVAALVLGTLQDCADWLETVAFHDWVHPLPSTIGCIRRFCSGRIWSMGPRTCRAGT